MLKERAPVKSNISALLGQTIIRHAFSLACQVSKKATACQLLVPSFSNWIVIVTIDAAGADWSFKAAQTLFTERHGLYLQCVPGNRLFTNGFLH